METLNKKIGFLLTILFITISCTEEFLNPKALSFYSPENTYTNSEGMRAALAACAVKMRFEWLTEGAPIITEFSFSEAGVDGTTDRTDPAQNMNTQITPDAQLYDGSSYNSIGDYWTNGYEVIKYANTVVSRIDGAEFSSSEEKNEILGIAYFFRAFQYYRLTNQFGDVPLILKEVTAPKTDYYSTKREVILRKCKEDLEFAAQWIPHNDIRGVVTKGAVNHLLTKVNLALGEFDDAIQSASEVIDGGKYSLVTERFGVDKDDPTKNVIWDLHQHENKYVAENTEAIMLVIDRLGIEGSTDWGSQIMRTSVPNWGRNIFTPSGRKGVSDAVGIAIDHSSKYGRGIARLRGTKYSMRTIWTDETDLRHADGNWVDMEDLVYNDPGLLNNDDPWYGQPLRLRSNTGQVLCLDTIRSWFSWPHYKIFIDDPTKPRPEGGHTDWYVFRLAETYLLRAEAYIWKGDLGMAAADINAVRVRANAAPFTSDQVDIGTVLDERCRELWFEEPRKTELTRISYILAETGKTAPNGKTYNLEDFSLDNYFYDRIMEYGDFYNKGVVTNNGKEFTISPYHVLWPIPRAAIRANTNGHINQNEGYSGAESNIPPLTEIIDE